ncbi:MAG: hypothetical protein Q9177_005115, partial [Variospora cf. flavescens]
MPALKPLFSKVLGTTVSSPSSSKRSFRKIELPSAGQRFTQAHTASGRSSIRGDKLEAEAKVGYRVSSQLEFEVSQDYEPSDAALAEYFRRANNSWAQEPDIELKQKPAIEPGGYTHIDDASDASS